MNVSITGRKFVLTLLQLDCGFLSPKLGCFGVERFSATLTVMGLQSLSNLLLLDNEKGGEDHSKNVDNELMAS